MWGAVAFWGSQCKRGWSVGLEWWAEAMAEEGMVSCRPAHSQEA